MFRLRTFKYYVNMNCIVVEHEGSIRNADDDDTHQHLGVNRYLCSPGNGTYMLFMSVFPAKDERE